MYQKDQKITGVYFGISFHGTINCVEPNWEIGSRNAVNIYVSLDTEMKLFGMRRNSLALLGVNPLTGKHFNRVKNWEIDPS